MDENNLKIWLVPLCMKLQPISFQEELIARKLEKRKQREFIHSRGYARLALSEIFKIAPLEVPLIAPPGKPPKLLNNSGFLSISHCKNALLLGWSPNPIGVDIELINRSFNAKKLVNRFYSEAEIDDLAMLKGEELRIKVLELWVVKEASVKLKRSNLALNLNQWEWKKEELIATHKSFGDRLNIKMIEFQGWIIAIAFESESVDINPLICFRN